MTKTNWTHYIWLMNMGLEETAFIIFESLEDVYNE